MTSEGTKEMRYVFLACFALCLCSPAIAQQNRFQGVAAADTARGSSDVYVEGGFTRDDAMEAARMVCYQFSNGQACKSIAAPPSNHFVVIACNDDGRHVHMGADNTAAEAEHVARLNASGFGRRRCNVIYQD